MNNIIPIERQGWDLLKITLHGMLSYKQGSVLIGGATEAGGKGLTL
jgi:hypothetical protein